MSSAEETKYKATLLVLDQVLVIFFVIIYGLQSLPIRFTNFTYLVGGNWFQWNEVVRSFRCEMPTSRHRHHLRSYDDTFTGSEAIDWLHKSLLSRSHLLENKAVNRCQATALLNQFYTRGLFSAVVDSRKSRFTLSAIRDDSTLYK